MKLFILGLIGLVAAQKGKNGKGASMVSEAKMATPTNASSAPANATGPMQPVHAGVETTENATAPVLTNAMTDWANALRVGIDSVNGISNHHHARWLGLLGETVLRALNANKNKLLTDEVVTSYAAHQFISYNFPQLQSGYYDPLLNVYLNYYNGTYRYRDALDKLVLPVVKKMLVRETGRGIVNFVQIYVAPSTIGVDQDTLKKYEGKYQFTDVPNDKVTVSYKDKPTKMNWQERGHFGTIKPYFKALSTYAQGLTPIVVGTPQYNENLAESQKLGSNDKKSKDSYNWDTPFFWLADWSHLPVVWTQIARAHLKPDLSNLETARFFATLGLGIFEACNTCYGMKWGRVSGTSPLWRPITAIRSGDTFGHKAVADWTPQLTTPMHPEYPSGHCAHTGAAMEVLRLVLGKDDVPMVIETDWNHYNPTATPLPNRKFANLTSIYQDVENSRVMGGVHWRNSCVDANTFAKRAAQEAHAFFYKK